MIKMLFSFVVTVVVARWIYAEVQLSRPEVIPAIDYALEIVRIPTHDQWDRERLDQAAKFLSDSLISVKTAKADTGREILARTGSNGCKGGFCGAAF